MTLACNEQFRGQTGLGKCAGQLSLVTEPESAGRRAGFEAYKHEGRLGWFQAGPEGLTQVPGMGAGESASPEAVS